MERRPPGTLRLSHCLKSVSGRDARRFAMRGIRLLVLALAVGASLVALPLAAQENALSGTVSSALDQAPLPGATVSIPALGISATTDSEGRYLLPFPAEAAGKTVEARATLPPFQPDTEEVT